jgi:hypothetical protein
MLSSAIFDFATQGCMWSQFSANATMTEPDHYRLICLAIDLELDSFPVLISKRSDSYELKNLILAEGIKELATPHHGYLKLYLANAPNNRDVLRQQLNPNNKLDENLTIAQLFPQGPQPGVVHILCRLIRQY